MADIMYNLGGEGVVLFGVSECGQLTWLPSVVGGRMWMVNQQVHVGEWVGGLWMALGHSGGVRQTVEFVVKQ